MWLGGVKATIALVCEGVERLGGGDGVFGSVFVEKLFWNYFVSAFGWLSCFLISRMCVGQRGVKYWKFSSWHLYPTF